MPCKPAWMSVSMLIGIHAEEHGTRSQPSYADEKNRTFNVRGTSTGQGACHPAVNSTSSFRPRASAHLRGVVSVGFSGIPASRRNGAKFFPFYFDKSKRDRMCT